ncbi:MAG: hypothetical protein ACRD96_07760, partial [Bryobacteraceae bacterium]
VNAEWCIQIDAPVSGLGCDADGFVPGYRQAWPGGTQLDIYGGPSHTNEQTNTLVHNEIMGILQNNKTAFGLNVPP